LDAGNVAEGFFVCVESTLDPRRRRPRGRPTSPRRARPAGGRCPRGAPPSIDEQPRAVLLAFRARRSAPRESCRTPPQRAANRQSRQTELSSNPPDGNPGGNELDNESVPLPPGHGAPP